jgi:hypothetical protein
MPKYFLFLIKPSGAINFLKVIMHAWKIARARGDASGFGCCCRRGGGYLLQEAQRSLNSYLLIHRRLRFLYEK